jgi:hypothetical protein
MKKISELFKIQRPPVDFTAKKTKKSDEGPDLEPMGKTKRPQGPKPGRSPGSAQIIPVESEQP